MKILGVSAGTRSGSNDCMCTEALMGAKSVGAEVEFIRLFDLNINHCTGCVACVNSIFNGRGNMCAIKDDFDWLLDKMLDADGIIFSVPIFEKGAAGIFHTIMDRFGPRMDRGNNIIATQIAEKLGGKIPDPRILKDKVISYMGIGGSDWMTRIEADFGIHALTPMWKTIDNEVFSWSLGILSDQIKVQRANQIGKNLAEAAKDLKNAVYQGDKGVCSHCHCREFYFSTQGKAICCQCGIEGVINNNNGVYTFEFPEEQLRHAHDTLDGKFIHAADIDTNNRRAGALRGTSEYKERVQAYRDFIAASKPSEVK
ncbi:MAG: reductase [Firmicutes bacterium]|nr:reductase [Bacillota bacterium]